MMDPEIEAMAKVADALTGLEEEARVRVVVWAAQRFSVALPRAPELKQTPPQADPGEGESVGPDTSQFHDFHDLFDAASPDTGLGRILVTAYWFQVVQGEESLDSFQINRELRNLGHPSANITRDLQSLIQRSPRLVLQVRKEGNTRQARKKYRLTREGIKLVERMLQSTETGL